MSSHQKTLLENFKAARRVSTPLVAINTPEESYFVREYLDEARDWINAILEEAEACPHTREEWRDGLCRGSIEAVMTKCKAALSELPQGSEVVFTVRQRLVDGTKGMTLSLPYPPTMNTYWRQFRGRAILSARGREFRTEVMASILQHGKPNKLTSRLSVCIQACPPDRRRRDLDNIVKPVLDALEHAGVYEDDCQIDDLHVKRGPITPHGETIVIIETIQEPTPC